MNKDQNRIEVGDIVSVDFNQAQRTLSYNAEVLYVPVATGDSWIFRDLAKLDGHLYYVSEGCTITLLEKGK